MQRSIAKWYVHHFRALDVKALNDFMFIGGLLWGGLWATIAFHMFGPSWLSFFGGVFVAGVLCGPITMVYIRNLEQKILEELEEQNEPTRATTSEDEISSVPEM